MRTEYMFVARKDKQAKMWREEGKVNRKSMIWLMVAENWLGISCSHLFSFPWLVAYANPIHQICTTRWCLAACLLAGWLLLLVRRLRSIIDNFSDIRDLARFIRSPIICWCFSLASINLLHARSHRARRRATQSTKKMRRKHFDYCQSPGLARFVKIYQSLGIFGHLDQSIRFAFITDFNQLSITAVLQLRTQLARELKIE